MIHIVTVINFIQTSLVRRWCRIVKRSLELSSSCPTAATSATNSVIVDKFMESYRHLGYQFAYDLGDEKDFYDVVCEFFPPAIDAKAFMKNTMMEAWGYNCGSNSESSNDSEFKLPSAGNSTKTPLTWKQQLALFETVARKEEMATQISGTSPTEKKKRETDWNSTCNDMSGSSKRQKI